MPQEARACLFVNQLVDRVNNMIAMCRDQTDNSLSGLIQSNVGRHQNLASSTKMHVSDRVKSVHYISTAILGRTTMPFLFVITC